MNIDLNALRTIETERGVSMEELLSATAGALLHAYREYRDEAPKAHTKARVDIDTDTGEANVMVTETDPETGEVVKEYDDTPVNFSRIGAPAVREAIIRRLREAEAERTFDSYSDLQGKVVSGIVQRDAIANSRGIVVVQLGTELDSQDGILLPAEQIPGENLQHGDRVKAYVVGVNRNGANVQINLSRTHPELVRGLFELEIPEVADRAVEIVGIAREAGYRSKVAVVGRAKGLNAKGACIGPRGRRVNNITAAIAGEKIDIIDYHQDPQVYVGNALAPSKVVRVEVLDSHAQIARVIVPDYQLSLAIGKEGQNARLAARLTGWKIDIHSNTEQLEPAPDSAPDSGSADGASGAHPARTAAKTPARGKDASIADAAAAPSAAPGVAPEMAADGASTAAAPGVAKEPAQGADGAGTAVAPSAAPSAADADGAASAEHSGR